MEGEEKNRARQYGRFFLPVVIISLAAILVFFLFFWQTPPDPQTKALSLLPASMHNPWDYNKSAWDRNTSNNFWNNPYSEWDITVSNATGADRFIRDKPNENDPLPYFSVIPEGSRGKTFQNFTLLGTGDRYIAEAWYFSNTEDLTVAENELGRFLEKNGNTGTVDLDFSDIPDAGSISFPAHACRPGPCSMTGYESNSTSGYFLVLERPRGLYSGHYIVYYGVVDSPDLKKHAIPVKTLAYTVMSRIAGIADTPDERGDPGDTGLIIRGLHPSP